MKDPNRQAQLEKRLLAICPFALIFSLITTLARSAERESAFATLLSFGIPIVVTMSVIALGIRVLGRTPPDATGRTSAIFFMVLGAVAGLAVLILRINAASGDPAPSSAWAKSTAGGVKEMTKAIMEWSDSQKTLDNTRWQQTAVSKGELRELSLEDLRAHRIAQDYFQHSVWHLETVLVELQKNGTLASVKSELVARGADPNMFDLALVKTLQRMALAGRDLSKLMEANFEDWRANGLPDKEHAVTPWQKQARALADEILALQAEGVKKSQAAATPSK